MAHADERTYGAQAETFLTRVYRLPDDALLEEAEEGIENRKDFENAAQAHLQRDREDVAEENARLFYVGITRTEQVLLVTATGAPYTHFALLAEADPESVAVWDTGEEDKDTESEEAGAEEAPSALFPDFNVDPHTADRKSVV